MFFYLSKIITFLIDPLFLILVLLAIFLIKGIKRLQYRLVFVPVYATLYLASTSIVANTLMFHLERFVPAVPLMSHYDAVIVLSGMTGNQSHPNNKPEFSGAVDRILVGIQLVREGRADFLIISGGDGSLTQHNQPEAEILRDFAVRWGIKKERILIDAVSRNTFENAVETSKLVRNHELRHLLLITSAFHMFRSRGCFQRVGLDVDAYPVDFGGETKVADFRAFLPSSNSLAKTSLVIHEIVGILAYRIAGRTDYSFRI